MRRVLMITQSVYGVCSMQRKFRILTKACRSSLRSLSRPLMIILSGLKKMDQFEFRSIEGDWIQKLNENDVPASSIAIPPGGNLIISGHFNGDIKLWDITDGKLLHTLKGHTGEVTSLSISPSGNFLGSGAIDGIPRVWKMKSDQSEPQLEFVLKGHQGTVNDITFSPQGSLIATGSDDGTIRFWHIPE